MVATKIPIWTKEAVAFTALISQPNEGTYLMLPGHLSEFIHRGNKHGWGMVIDLLIYREYGDTQVGDVVC